MHPRLDYWKAQPQLAMKHLEASQAVAAALPEDLQILVTTRASQLNGCAFCLDMHAKDGFAIGMDPMHLIALSAWEESPLYTDRERAALAWTDALTHLHEGHVSDAVYERVRPHFTETELAALTFAIAQMNFWNRMAVACRTVPGAMDAQAEPRRAAKRAALAAAS